MAQKRETVTIELDKLEFNIRQGRFSQFAFAKVHIPLPIKKRGETWTSGYVRASVYIRPRKTNRPYNRRKHAAS